MSHSTNNINNLLSTPTRRGRGRPPMSSTCHFCNPVLDGYQPLRNHRRSCRLNYQNAGQREDIVMDDVSNQSTRMHQISMTFARSLCLQKRDDANEHLVRDLEAQFNQQFAPVGLSQMMLAAGSNTATMAEFLLVVDQQARTRLIITPNRRGSREIALNPTRVPRAGLRLRYDVIVVSIYALPVRNRPQWYEERVNWTVDQWKSVAWSDESRYRVVGVAIKALESSGKNLKGILNSVVGENERNTHHTPANDSNGSANNADDDDNENTTSNAI
ncbi:hypothetical protein [Parasitella parasitica]|uniref:Uncharacterized protein n=1 Tax=Parasitella parasitica TaxID=35722 RepID=A0A0B7NP16_9FUNG|nr:hypothetical protein [Parasitella parasitica]